MLTGVIIYGIFVIAKELDETFHVVEAIQGQVYDILGITEKPIYKCEKKKGKGKVKVKGKNETDTNSTLRHSFAFGEDLDDYGDDDDNYDFIENPKLDEEQLEEEKELKRILNKKSLKTKKIKENKGNKRTSTANEKNTKKKQSKEIKHKHQLIGNKTGTKENIKKKKLRTIKKIRKCTRGREKRHNNASNDRA